MRVATIDMGTNSTRLLVADVDGGRIEAVHRESRVTGLGRGVEISGSSRPRRSRASSPDRRLPDDRPASSSAVETFAFATSAARDAPTREAFIAELRERFALPARILERPRGGGADLPRRPRRLRRRRDGGHRHRRRLDRADRRLRRRADLQRVAAARRRPPHRAPPPHRPAADGRARVAVGRRRLGDRRRRSPPTPACGPERGVAVAGTPAILAAIDLDLERFDHDRSKATSSSSRPCRSSARGCRRCRSTSAASSAASTPTGRRRSSPAWSS